MRTHQTPVKRRLVARCLFYRPRCSGVGWPDRVSWYRKAEERSGRHRPRDCDMPGKQSRNLGPVGTTYTRTNGRPSANRCQAPGHRSFSSIVNVASRNSVVVGFMCDSKIRYPPPTFPVRHEVLCQIEICCFPRDGTSGGRRRQVRG